MSIVLGSSLLDQVEAATVEIKDQLSPKVGLSDFHVLIVINPLQLSGSLIAISEHTQGRSRTAVLTVRIEPLKRDICKIIYEHILPILNVHTVHSLPHRLIHCKSICLFTLKENKFTCVLYVTIFVSLLQICIYIWPVNTPL